MFILGFGVVQWHQYGEEMIQNIGLHVSPVPMVGSLNVTQMVYDNCSSPFGDNYNFPLWCV